MNATKQGKQAGQSTRRAVNTATNFTVEGGKTVATAVGGFFSGFFSNPDLPTQVRVTPAPKRIRAK